MTMLHVPYGFSRAQGVLLLSASADAARVLVRQGSRLEALVELRRHLGVPIVTEWVTADVFERQLAERLNEGQNNAAEVIADAGQEVDLARLMTDLPAAEDLLESQDDTPIVRTINALLAQAVRQGASDIHLEPYEHDSAVRFRRDGWLVDVARPRKALHAPMVSRIKIMAHLDIAEKRLPQDGRMGLRLAGREVDVRVSTLPTTHGERLVLRLLDKGSGLRQLDSLGMSATTVQRFSRGLNEPHGIVLVTGPTGSGKSTTLYAALQAIDARTRNMITVEDPVEYQLPGVGQIQVNPKIDLTFAKALRSILRQDPDVIMIGEIRDLETAQIAVQASLTGHLVLATLHTNDAVSALTRLIDMGVEPFLLASSVRAVMAQRLVRKLCLACRQPLKPSESHAWAAELPGWSGHGWQAVGCSTCSRTGYAGRTGIYEYLTMDETLQRQVHAGTDETQWRRHVRSLGVHSLKEDGVRLVEDGTTSCDELLRVTRD